MGREGSEGEEEDALDAEELGHRAERLQVVVRAQPEDREAVEGEADADVVDDGDVEVARVGAQVAVVVLVAGLEDERGNGEDGLDVDVFWGRGGG